MGSKVDEGNLWFWWWRSTSNQQNRSRKNNKRKIMYKSTKKECNSDGKNRSKRTVMHILKQIIISNEWVMQKQNYAES